MERWNRTLKKYDVQAEIKLPSLRFNRQVGIHSGHTYDADGTPIKAAEFEGRKAGWFPSDEDYAYVKACMIRVHEVGKIANWIAPPHQGIDSNPFAYEYVKFH